MTRAQRRQRLAADVKSRVLLRRFLRLVKFAVLHAVAWLTGADRAVLELIASVAGSFG